MKGGTDTHFATMNRIACQYLGLELDSPVVFGSSGFTATAGHIREAERAGAGAVVLKSIFEEQILGRVQCLNGYNDYPEAADYLNRYVAEHDLEVYLDMIRAVRRECALPVIASICCRQAGPWADFARRIEKAGADAIELNVFLLPADGETSSAAVERRYLDIVERVRDAVSLPLSVKLGQGLTDPLGLVREIAYRKVQGVVLFNRFYPVDIDIEHMTFRAGDIFSRSAELSNVLRWTALVDAHVPQIDVAASTGVHTGEDVVKALLAGASAVQVASVLYEKGPAAVTAMNAFLNQWMERRGFDAVARFAGRMNARRIADPELYERTQFMKYFSEHE